MLTGVIRLNPYTMPHKESYDRHNEWYNKHFPSEQSKTDMYKKIRHADKHNVSSWLQNIFFSCLEPLLDSKDKNWLTVGDAYGFDAQHILSSNNMAMATDLNTDFLNVAVKEGIVSVCAAENAEKLTFEDERFDYVLCKESYHHFPRPYAAVYEMLRVAKIAVVIIEPQDPVARMPLLLLINNLLANNVRLLNKIWKNRFSYEPVGNFVYKVSEREFEKLAAGLGLKMVAFKKINPNFWFKGAESIPTSNKNRKFLFIRLKRIVLDILVSLKIIPSQVLASIIFKQAPDDDTIDLLRRSGYRLVNIPVNPYLS